MKKPILILCLLLLFAAGCAPHRPESPGDVPAADAPLSVVVLPETTAPPLPLPTGTPDPLGAAEGVYTIAWLSDTQHYSRKYPVIFQEQTRFLRDNAERLRLAYIVHTGDLVHTRTDQNQWQAADSAMRCIDAIPYGVCAGNHDVGTKPEDCDYSTYGTFFGQARMEGKPWYGGSYENNRGHFDLIEAGSTAYLFVYLGYHIDRDGMDWANRTFAAYPDRIGVLCTHSYFDHDLTLTDQGELLFDGVVKTSPNLYMVLCGHRYNSSCVPVKIEDGGEASRTVLQMICNYQAAGQTGGEGYLRLMQIDEAAGEIRFLNYSPLLGDFVYYDTPEHRAEQYAFDPSGEQGSVRIPWLP